MRRERASSLLCATSALAVLVLAGTSSCSAAGKPAVGPMPPATGVIEDAAAPIERRSGFATAADGTRLYWEACGKGPGIVLVHGLGGNHAVWFQQVARFARTHTVVTVSQRGFAPSGGDGGLYDPRVLADDLGAAMDAAGLRRAAVVGQSMGGWTALAFAIARPDRVDALVLADSPGGIDDEVLREHLRGVTEAASRLRSTPPPLGVHPSLSSGFSQSRPDLAYLYQALATFGSPPPGRIAGQLAASRVSPRELRGLAAPVLFVVGAEDGIFPPAVIRRAASHVRGAKVVEIPGAGHSPYFEVPGTWNEVVAKFLAD